MPRSKDKADRAMQAVSKAALRLPGEGPSGQWDGVLCLLLAPSPPCRDPLQAVILSVS